MGVLYTACFSPPVFFKNGTLIYWVLFKAEDLQFGTRGRLDSLLFFCSWVWGVLLALAIIGIEN